MDFEITELVPKKVFLVKALHGEFIPKASPAAVGDVVMEIRRQCGVNPSGIRFFWPEDDTVLEMIVIVS
jgi:hypothetical protein